MKKIKPAPYNPRKINDEKLADLKNFLSNYGDLSGIVHNETTGNLVGGNQRSKVMDINNCEIQLLSESKQPDGQGTTALGFVIWHGNKYAYRRVKWPLEVEKRANIIANKAGGEWDFEMMAKHFEVPEVLESGFEINELPMHVFFPDDDSTGEKAPKQTSQGIIRYEIIFETEGQQKRFTDWLKDLKDQYPEIQTISRRIDQYLIEHHAKD